MGVGPVAGTTGAEDGEAAGPPEGAEDGTAAGLPKVVGK